MTDQGQTERQTKPQKARGGRPRKARGAATSSDAPDSRWTVRGVPMNVRGLASKCAERQGKTIGDWLSEAVVAYSKSDDKRVSADGSPNLADPQLAEFMRALDDRLTKLEGHQGKGWIGRLLGR